MRSPFSGTPPPRADSEGGFIVTGKIPSAPMLQELTSTRDRPRRSKELCAILDFGSQYSQLIARQVRENRVYCEILRHDTP